MYTSWCIDSLLIVIFVHLHYILCILDNIHHQTGIGVEAGTITVNLMSKI